MRSSTDTAPPALAAALATTALVLGWRGADWPAQLLRIELVESAGPTIWNNLWFAGHHTPGYGVLFPLLGALVGPAAVAVASCTVAAWSFHDLARGHGRTLAASLLFAAGTVVNVAIGRLTFALGLAIAVSALAVARRGRYVVATVLVVATAPASPVAAVVLAVALAAWWWHERSWRLAVLTALALAPVAAAALLFPQGGQFPFRAGALAWTVAAAAVVALVTTAPVVRTGALLYAAMCVAAFVVANPLGANATRLGMFAAAPIVVLTARRIRAPMVLIALTAMVWWLWSPALDGIVRAGRDPSTAVDYHLPLVAAVRAQAVGPARVEVVPTQRHWEAVHVASRLPIARGWERQLDMGRNAIFYGVELDPEAYHEWLREHAVQFVALADVPLDPSGVHEARFVQRRSAVPRARVARRALAAVPCRRRRAAGRRPGTARRPRCRAHRARGHRRSTRARTRAVDESLVARSARIRRRRPRRVDGRRARPTGAGDAARRAYVRASKAAS